MHAPEPWKVDHQGIWYFIQDGGGNPVVESLWPSLDR